MAEPVSSFPPPADPVASAGGAPSAPFERLVRLMELVAASPAAPTAAQCARRLGLPRQSAHRLLGQLEAAGLTQRSLDGGYQPGDRLGRLALAGLAHAWRGGDVRQVLRELVERTGESCNIGVLDRDEVVYVDRVECDWPLRMQLGAGSRVPLHATASGKLLLAHLPARARRRVLAGAPFRRFTDRTIVGAEAMQAELERIRRLGHAVNDGENTVGLVGVAVPVRGADGRVLAGLSVHAPAARTPLDRVLAHLDDLRSLAVRLEHGLKAAARGGRDDEREQEETDG